MHMMSTMDTISETVWEQFGTGYRLEVTPPVHLSLTDDHYWLFEFDGLSKLIPQAKADQVNLAQKISEGIYEEIADQDRRTQYILG